MDADPDDPDPLSEIRVLRVAPSGGFELVTPRCLGEVTPRSWQWRSPAARIGAMQRLRECEATIFPEGEGVCDRSSDTSESDDDSSAVSSDSSGDSSFHPSDGDGASSSSEEAQEGPDERAGWTKGGRRRLNFGDIFAELTEWVRVPMCFRAYSKMRKYAPSRFRRLRGEFLDQVCDEPMELPVGKRPCVMIRLKSCLMAMRMIANRSRRALAAIRGGDQPPPKRRRLAAKPEAPAVQRGPSLLGFRPPLDMRKTGGAAAPASATAAGAAAASAACGAGTGATGASAAAAADATAASATGPDVVTYHALYIDTAGGQLAGARVTTAALRKAPPDPPYSSGDKQALAIIAVWLGSFKGKACVRFAERLPPLPPNTIHHHDLAAAWSLTDAATGVACCALDTSRAASYWTKKPCPCCSGTLRDVHSLSRTAPCAPRVLRTLHDKRPVFDYVYPRGHHLKNSVVSVWGTLCIVVGRYDPDLAAELERQFPRGDGFNPRLVGLTQDQLDERTTRKPAADARCRNAKDFIRQPDEVLFVLIDRVRDDPIVFIQSPWSVRRFLKYTIQYLRCLLDPEDGMPWEAIQHLGRTLFRVYKHWLAASFPFEVNTNGANSAQFASLTAAERKSLVQDIKFNTAEVLCGIPVHYSLEHAVEPFLKYPFEVAASLALEEGEENTFLDLAAKLPKMSRRRIHRIPFLKDIGYCTMLVSLTGWPGDTQERNRRYWTRTDDPGVGERTK